MFSVSPTPSLSRQEERVEAEKIRIWREEQVKRLEEKGLRNFYLAFIYFLG